MKQSVSERSETNIPTPISMDNIAQWLGWDRINLELANEKIAELTEENKKLNELLAEAKLGGSDG